MSAELAQTRSAMKSMDRIFDGYGGATGSTDVEHALEGFFSHSSDNRKKMDGLLERASGLLGGLAEGTTSVDKALNDSLQSAGGSPPVVSAVPAAGGGRQ
ncbi:MAG: hypothetical protein M3Z25_04630 [Actinomycetota bacterium]|nr:hypothetical protein [Actinomycetota bacterium]